MSKITSIVGMLLIIAAGVLAAVSSTKEDVIKSKKEISSKYLKNAEAALAQKDINKAFKFVKLALKADPDNKAVFKVLQKISDAKCANAAPAKVQNSAEKKETNTTQKTAPAPAPAAAEEEEMGC